jgi:hypothetical protein
MGGLISIGGYGLARMDTQNHPPAPGPANTYDAARVIIEGQSAPQIEALLTKTTGKPATCKLESTLWAVIVPGVKFEGMIACATNGATYHTHIFVTRYADDDGQMFWEIGDLKRTEPQ